MLRSFSFHAHLKTLSKHPFETQKTNQSQISVFILQTHYSIDIFLYNKKAIYKLKNQNEAAQNDYE